MRKFFRTLLTCALLTVVLTVSAHAAGDTLKVGLYYGSDALFSANLQNYRGSGYQLGWFDEGSREFVAVASLTEEKISMTADGNIYISGGSYYRSKPSKLDSTVGGYHVQIDQSFAAFEEAKYVADQFRSGFVAYLGGEYVVRVSNFPTREEAEINAAAYTTYTWTDIYGSVHGFEGSVVSPSGTAVTITVTTTDKILFEFDCYGARSLGIMPVNWEGKALTWFKGYKWYGGFEYRRSTGGNISVINVVNSDDYVKGVLPYEMSPKWPLEALKAQAVCARTYAQWQSKHDKYGFDVCRTTDCQVYNGTNQASSLTDQAAEETSGMVITYNGSLAETYYYSSNGGASENSENVWSAKLPYLRGKADPYEATISIPSYSYTQTYTFDQLTQVLNSKGYSIGQVKDVYVSATTEVGNVREVTFVGSNKALKVTGEKCKTIFYTTLFGETKSLKSMRFTINGGTGSGQYYVNSGSTIPALSGIFTISGKGSINSYSGDSAGTYVITSAGVQAMESKGGASSNASANSITITGTGSGHNVGMSQYGAKAMAEMGYDYTDILSFYFTGIDLERVG